MASDDKKKGDNNGGGGNGLRGCIRSSRGPWVVHRKTRKGGVETKFRFPSDRERKKNTERERRRRSVTSNIFLGLRTHGNYKLPPKADSNEVLMAVCEEAGWIVQDDGTILGRKTPGFDLGLAAKTCLEEEQEQGFCTCSCDDENLPHSDESDLTLSLSLSLSLSLPVCSTSNSRDLNRAFM